jgi:hypothetical protein
MYLFKIFSYLFKYFPIINVDLAINNELVFFSHAMLLILLGLYIYCCVIFEFCCGWSLCMGNMRTTNL